MLRFASAILCLLVLAVADAGQAAHPAFRVSIDDDMWRKFGWRYPVSLLQHLEHVAGRKDVWYVANGWLHCYRYVAEHAQVERQP